MDTHANIVSPSWWLEFGLLGIALPFVSLLLWGALLGGNVPGWPATLAVMALDVVIGIAVCRGRDRSTLATTLVATWCVICAPLTGTVALYTFLVIACSGGGCFS